MSKNKEKIFVIGLDGATLDLLNPLMDEGRMPFLSRVIGEGVLGEAGNDLSAGNCARLGLFPNGKEPWETWHLRVSLS